MKPIAIFRHQSSEGPGFFQQVLNDYHIPLKLIRIDANDPLPNNPDEYSALVFMGGPMSVNDPLPWIEQELTLIRMAMDRRLPVLGHCLGGQLISKALGGRVGRNPEKEIGWFPVTRCDDVFARSWESALPARFEAFHWHGETFSIPAGATHLLQSELCANQGFSIDNCLALQCHVEMTAPMVEEWASANADELAAGGRGIQSSKQITAGLTERVTALQTVARILYRRWLLPLLETND